MGGDSQARFAILGASRGLGAAFCRQLAARQLATEVLLVSRKKQRLEKVGELFDPRRLSLLVADFSKESDQKKVLEILKEKKPDRVFYFAGGGPHGPFFAKEWKDHMWAWQVSFLFPARLLHFCLSHWEPRQMVFVGSALAENQADPLAASYVSAKHALKALLESVGSPVGATALGLFSPPYMDTELLPKNAAPRLKGEKIYSPDLVSQDLASWVFEPGPLGYRRVTDLGIPG